MKPKISVIVCTHNGARVIQDCLNSLQSQKYPDHKYEVILVNDCSIDNTASILNRYPFKTIHNSVKKGLAESRNIGTQQATGKIIAFTDDDCIPNQNWLQAIDKIFEDKKIAGISGFVRTHEILSIVQKYIDATKPLTPLSMDLAVSGNILYRLILYIKRQLNIVHQKNWKKPQQILSVVGANMAFRISILTELSGFDPMLTFGGEEEDLCYRFYKTYKNNSYILYYDPGLIVSHKFDSGLYRAIRRNYMYGIGSFRLYRKHKNRSLTILPFPVLTLAIAIATGLYNWKLLIVTLILLPQVFYFHWIYSFMITLNFSKLMFAYMQLLFELMFNFGVLKEFINKK